MTLKFHSSFCKVFVFFFLNTFCTSVAQAQSRDTLYIVDKQAQFVGGQRALSMYWQQHFKIPLKTSFKKNDGEGIVSFTIDTLGRVLDVFIKQRLTPELDAAAIRAVTEMPRWQPAEKNGKKIAMSNAITYFLTPPTAQNGMAYPTDLEEAEKVVSLNGFNGALWTGGAGLTGNFENYVNPARFALGLTFGYSFNRLSLAFEYDITAPSKVRKAFEYDKSTATTDMKMNSFNIYFPIGYRFDWSEKWTYTPYIAPTINVLDLKETSQKNGDSVVESVSVFGFSVGLCADFVVSQQAIMDYKGKQLVNTALVRTRMNINPMNFASVTPVTKLRGTAISLTVGIMLKHRREK